jgi:cysteine synthase A
MAHDRHWVTEALRRIEADFVRSADTHLFPFDVPSMPGVRLYFKDESSHPTGSLKHRLARSLFLYALCNGWLGPQTTVIEASSGSTAVSEAYFARLLGLPFIAVMPHATSAEKIAQIEFYGGGCHFVDRAEEMDPEARRLAGETGGHFMDQFTFAERVTDWRGNNNIAESIFDQMAREPHPEPAWVVCPAGTGGTSATIGRFVRYRGLDTKICVVDPEGSVFLDYWRTGDRTLTTDRPPMVEGIGRPRVEPSFLREVVDRMIRVPDAASFAGVRFLHSALGRRCGGSTGTNLWGALQLMAEMHADGQAGSVVTLICDGGSRYLDTYFDDGWLADHGYDISPHLEVLERVFETGVWPSDDVPG